MLSDLWVFKYNIVLNLRYGCILHIEGLYFEKSDEMFRKRIHSLNFYHVALLLKAMNMLTDQPSTYAKYYFLKKFGYVYGGSVYICKLLPVVRYCLISSPKSSSYDPSASKHYYISKAKVNIWKKSFFWI